MATTADAPAQTEAGRSAARGESDSAKPSLRMRVKTYFARPRVREVLAIIGLVLALLIVFGYLMFVDQSPKVNFVYNQF